LPVVKDKTNCIKKNKRVNESLEKKKKHGSTRGGRRKQNIEKNVAQGWSLAKKEFWGNSKQGSW